ncbi:MAG: tetratricopeptide repeat protein [Planctomycetes bacterium]|nr:tetratricopeptide repeat protein [Planctomycetota bacterium]
MNFRLHSFFTVLVALAAGSAGAWAQRPPTSEEAALLVEERIECDRLARRGEARTALRRIEELLEAQPEDLEARLTRARCHLALIDYEAARAEAASVRLAAGEKAAAAPVRAAAARLEAEILVEFGRGPEAFELLESEHRSLNIATDARDAWARASAAFAAGKRDIALQTLAIGADTGADQPWDGGLARGLCRRELGQLEAASQSYVAALDALKGAGGDEPDLLVALGDLYFEADKEVAEGASRSAAKLYREALQLHPTHEGALLGLFALHRYNWQRQRESASDILSKALSLRPQSIRTLIVAAGADLDDGQLKSARERLAVLDNLAGGRREVRILHATLSWIEHDPDGCRAILKELIAADPADSTPEREVGRHLLELYRFAEGLPFVKAAAERDPSDWEALTQLGRALANTGDEVGARAALDAAQKAAAGRQDAWRDNMRLVMKRTAERHVTETRGDLTFSFDPEGGEVLSTYLVPFYANARDELVARYGFTPTPTTIEIFRAHKDFSVRSTGFEGFPALGVCFGPVVTAVSPLWEMRGTQSWARTSFHEFTHVIHLGLSHNRCPRWITEGLATWEEVNRNPSWTRNMRRELVDALANGQVIPVRELNRAFRGPRILFGYYQGGLMCQMLIERSGFARIVKFLEAFDRGLDLDASLKEVYRTTPEQLDRDFLEFVRKETANLKIEPRWDSSRVARLALGLSPKPPKEASKLPAWIDDWCTVAWSAWQRDRKLDAQEALRHLKDITPEPARAALLRGFIALADQDQTAARRFFESALASGGDDYRARIALATFASDAGETDVAEQHLLAAVKAFPGYDDQDLSAELRLAALYAKAGRDDEALASKEQWIAWNAGDITVRREVAEWHAKNGRYQRASTLYGEINEVDPFLREVHRAWGDALYALGAYAEALREYGVVLIVPHKLDAPKTQALTDDERAELMGLQSACLAALQRRDEALARANEALALDPDCASAKETLEKLQ